MRREYAALEPAPDAAPGRRGGKFAPTPGVPLFLQRQPAGPDVVPGTTPATFGTKGFPPNGVQSGTNFDALSLSMKPARMFSPGGLVDLVLAPGQTHLFIDLRLAVEWKDFDRNFEDSQGKKPFRNLRLTRAQRAASTWTEDEKTAYVQNLRASIESAWSAKHDFILKDDLGAEINRAQVCVRVAVVDAGAKAHFNVAARKMPPGIKPEQEIRSWVDRSGKSSVLDSTDEDPTDFTKPAGGAYLRRVGPFEQGKADITPALDGQIDTIAHDVKARIPPNPPPDSFGPSMSFVGRASSEGGAGINKTLSDKRVNNVEERTRTRLDSLGTPLGITITSARGEKNATTDAEFRRVDVSFDPQPSRSGKRTTAAHEAGHMFGLDDEYVEEEQPYGRFEGDRPDHYEKVRALMGEAAAEELLAQDSASIMAGGDVVRAGHYVFFLEAINGITGFTWQVAPPSGGGACTPTARTP